MVIAVVGGGVYVLLISLFRKYIFGRAVGQVHTNTRGDIEKRGWKGYVCHSVCVLLGRGVSTYAARRLPVFQNAHKHTDVLSITCLFF